MRLSRLKALRPFHLVDWAVRVRARFARRGEPSGLLILFLGGVGDSILFAVALDRFMQFRKPGERLTLLLRREGEMVSFLFPPDCERKVVRLDWLRRFGYRWRILKDLYDANYRLAISADFMRHPDLDEAMIEACRAPDAWAMIAAPSAKRTERLEWNQRLYTRLYDSGPVRTDAVLRHARFADWLAGKESVPPRIGVDPALLPAPLSLDAPTVVIQPYSSTARKHYPPTVYLEILNLLPSDWRVVATGAPDDPGRFPELDAFVRSPRVEFDDRPFADLVPLLRGARLVVSVDTGMMHLAVAVGARTICLASDAYAGAITPYHPDVAPDNAHFIRAGMDCEGCQGNCHLPPVEGMFPCVARVSIKEVLNVVSKEISR